VEGIAVGNSVGNIVVVCRDGLMLGNRVFSSVEGDVGLAVGI
jgi:hypothetical protein